jgi:hypothetical protein
MAAVRNDKMVTTKLPLIYGKYILKNYAAALEAFHFIGCKITA